MLGVLSLINTLHPSVELVSDGGVKRKDLHEQAERGRAGLSLEMELIVAMIRTS